MNIYFFYDTYHIILTIMIMINVLYTYQLKYKIKSLISSNDDKEKKINYLKSILFSNDKILDNKNEMIKYKDTKLYNLETLFNEKIKHIDMLEVIIEDKDYKVKGLEYKICDLYNDILNISKVFNEFKSNFFQNDYVSYIYKYKDLTFQQIYDKTILEISIIDKKKIPKHDEYDLTRYNLLHDKKTLLEKIKDNFTYIDKIFIKYI